MSEDFMAHQSAEIDVEDMVFKEPWSARLFGLTIALTEANVFTLKDFQAHLIATVGSFEKANCITDESEYYTRWLEALQSLLEEKQLTQHDALHETEEKVVERLLDLQHHRHHHHEASPGKPARIAPLLIA